MNKIFYQYAVLRYVHDPLTQEFLNVGVLLYAPEARHLGLLATDKYSRLSDAFLHINGSDFRSFMQALARRVESIRRRWEKNDWVSPPPDAIDTVLPQIMLPDDSSYVFGGIGGGITDDPVQELQNLYDRFVKRYMESEEKTRRDDKQVLQIYLNEFRKREIVEHLQPKRIETGKFFYDFDLAWKNERWHPFEPVSFDLAQEGSIQNKASRWIGNIASMRKSSELGTVYLLVGKPQDSQLQDAYENALYNLRESVEGVRLVEENEAGQFSNEIARIIQEHEQAEESS